ncbi:MAG: terpene cyclase/mutase family protein [Clostridia bacterium]|nr:terpene cyclase/mutase family protein [Clostridia bacterium]MDE7328495.1 terpene cyclase/mutase family protein [Clostridia bacterium]
MNKRSLKFLSVLLCGIIIVATVFCTATGTAFAQTNNSVSVEQIQEVADGIIEWKKSDVGSKDCLINDVLLRQAGSTPGDWYPIGLGRLGVADNQSGYLAVINDVVQKRYNTSDKLDRAKATEWHRISLAVLASGGNPRRMGDNGNIDLIADGTYNRVDENGVGILGRQGINGFIWGLITLDSMYYDVPQGAYYSRDDIILQILKLQLADGGWALTGTTSDPDITAMAIQSLAPYYNSEKEYDGKKVRTVVDEAIEWLSSVQLSSGDFYSWGMANCESTVQVVVALCSLGIDIFTDTRFIKTDGDGRQNTLYDGIMKYRTSSGGFTHSYVNDADNPSAVAGEPNTMASEQTLYGLTAIIRQQSGMRRLYDFRQEQSMQLQEQIKAVELKIQSLTVTSSTQEIKDVYDEYLAIDGSERSYVTNYSELSDLLAFAGIDYEEENITYNSGDAGLVTPTEYFTAEDIAAAETLPKTLTTAYRAEVLRLWQKIQNSVEFDRKQEMTILLEKAKNEIDALQDEIDSLQREIKEELYPFENIGLDKRKTVYDLYNRFMALSEYDRAQIEQADIEGLMRCKTQVDNLRTALIIGIVCAVVVIGLTVFVVCHIRSMKKKKQAKVMQESDE